MAQLRVLLGFADAADLVLLENASEVLAGLYSKPAIYPSPTVAKLDFDKALGDYRTALTNQDSSGEAGTAAKNQAREVLIGLMRVLAGYVQGVIQNPQNSYGLAELLESGFEAVSTNRAQHRLGPPTITDIMNSGAGQLTLRVAAVPNARMYEVQKKREDGPGTGTWDSAGVFASTRGMVVIGLVPGGLYAFQVRAMGGSTGFSDWSDAVSHRSL